MDYTKLNLKASSSPHIRSNEDVRSIMLDVIIAMVPALVAAIYFFGFRALTVTAVSVAACVFFEWLYCKIMKRPVQKVREALPEWNDPADGKTSYQWLYQVPFFPLPVPSIP